MKTITPGANSINVEWDYFLEKGEEYELVVGVCYGGEKSSNVTYGPVSVTGQEKGDGGGSSHEEDGGDGSGGGGDEEEPEMGDGEDEGGGDVADDGTDEEPDTGGSGQDGNEDEGTYKAEDKDTEDTPGFGAVVLAAAVGASALIAGLRRTRRRE